MHQGVYEFYKPEAVAPEHSKGVTSVVPINRITIGNSRLLGNFLTIGIGRLYDCTIVLLKSDNLITLYLKLNQIFVINLLSLTESYNFVHFIVCL